VRYQLRQSGLHQKGTLEVYWNTRTDRFLEDFCPQRTQKQSLLLQMFGCHFVAKPLAIALPNLVIVRKTPNYFTEKANTVNAIRKQLKGSSDKGFTLIELLVVVLILGILSVIAVVAVNNARATAIVKACNASALTYVNAFDAYVSQNSTPEAPGSGSVTTGDSGSVYGDAHLKALLVPNYMKSMADTADYTLAATYNATTKSISVAGTPVVSGTFNSTACKAGA
jgi:type IV pilus assembly protein PilA